MEECLKEQRSLSSHPSKSMKCSECENNIFKKPEDMSTPVAGLFYRVCFTFISAFMLGLSVESEGKTFLVTVLLFVFPLLREYLGFVANTPARLLLQNAEKSILILMLIISALGVTPACEITVRSQKSTIGLVATYPIMHNIYIPCIWLWYGCWLMFVFTTLDWIIYKPVRTEGISGIGLEL